MSIVASAHFGYTGKMTIKNTKILTIKQRKVFDFICAYVHDRGESPTVIEISRFLGVSSLRTVTQYLEALEQKQLIFRLNRQSRGIRLTHGYISETVTVPLVSNAGCDNMSVFAQQSFGEYVNIDRTFLHGSIPERVFAFRAVGESMIDAGIETGDMVLVERGADVKQRDKVVAVVDGMALIKQIHFSPNAVILSPMSKDPKYAPIVMRRDFQVFGKVIDVVKRMPDHEDLEYESIID